MHNLCWNLFIWLEQKIGRTTTTNVMKGGTIQSKGKNKYWNLNGCNTNSWGKNWNCYNTTMTHLTGQIKIFINFTFTSNNYHLQKGKNHFIYIVSIMILSLSILGAHNVKRNMKIKTHQKSIKSVPMPILINFRPKQKPDSIFSKEKHERLINREIKNN